MPKQKKAIFAAASRAAGFKTDHRADRSKRAHLRLSLAGWSNTEAAALTELLGKQGLCLQRVAPDGNCLFRALADNLWGESERHVELRAACVTGMVARSDHYAAFLLEEDLADLGVWGFDGYIEKMALDGTWGGNSELLAVADSLSREIIVHQAGERPWGVTPAAAAVAALLPPLHVAYDGTHYDSVRRMGAMEGPAEHERASLSFGNNQTAAAAATQHILPSRAETAVLRAFPDGSVSLTQAGAALVASLGNIDAAIDALALAAARIAAGGEGEEEGEGGSGGDAVDNNNNATSSSSTATADRLRRAAARIATAASGGGGSGNGLESATKETKKKEGARNGPCVCGSGKLTKKCCALKSVKVSASAMAVSLAASSGSGIDSTVNALSLLKI